MKELKKSMIYTLVAILLLTCVPVNVYAANDTLIYGDVNGDTKVNTGDIVYVRRFIAGGYNVDINEAAANVNGDDKVNTGDIILLRRFVAGGYGVTFPPNPGDCKHNLAVTEYKAASCIEDGNMEYWYCEKCEEYFADSEGTNIISSEDIVINATGHVGTVIPAIPPTATEEGWTEGMACDVCGQILVAPKPIPIPAPETYFITYDVNNGDAYLAGLDIENANPPSYRNNEEIRLMNLKVDGYVFEGWYTAAEGGDRVETIPEGSSGDKTLYAHWLKVPYLIVFDSPDVPVESITYTVDQSVALPKLSWFGYSFEGWTNEDGEVVTRIGVGTTGNKVFTANWTSNRNKVVANVKYNSPSIIEDSENGQILYMYNLGRVENVPLSEVYHLGYSQGIHVQQDYSVQSQIEKDEAERILQNIASATTDNANWELSEDWPMQDKVVGGEEIGLYGIDFSVPANLGNMDYIGTMENEDLFVTPDLRSNWNSEASFEKSQWVSHSMTMQNMLLDCIYKDYGVGVASPDNRYSMEFTSSISYENYDGYPHIFVYPSNNLTHDGQVFYESEATGCYRIVFAGTVHVFGVVGYDIATASYYTFTYSVLDEDTYLYLDYSRKSSTFDDCENGVIDFEIPVDIFEYASMVAGKDNNLTYRIYDSGAHVYKCVGNDRKNIVIPKYVTTDNGDGTYAVHLVNGIADGAFEGCSNLENVVALGVTKIGTNAFSGCTALNTFTINESVTSLGTNAFNGVEKLVVKTFSKDVAEAAENSGAKEVSIKLLDSGI